MIIYLLTHSLHGEFQKNKIINSPVYQKRKIGKIINNKNGNSETEMPSTNNNN